MACWGSKLFVTSPSPRSLVTRAIQVLSKYVAYQHHRRPEYLRNRTVIELGSGTGLVGIVAAMLEPSAHVWVTDQQ